ncbi:MAG: hypothetical protein K0S03_2461 [Burkholderiales bacterium]|nr:hypothetical protein [Burkholderiales bacterium]
MLQHGAQVLGVEQQQAGVVGDLEHEVEYALLRVVQAEQAREQERAHVGDGGAHRVARGAEQVPEDDGAGLVLELELEELGALGHLGVAAAGLGHAREVAFHVCHEDRNADARELFGQALQGHRLAGAGGAGDETVAVGERGKQVQRGASFLGYEKRRGHA